MSTLQARRLLAKNVNLPTLPSVMQKLSALLQDPDTGAREVGHLISEDVALTGKVLKIANSAYYGLRERCLAPQQAASILGIKVLRNVVLQASVMKQYDHLKGGAFDVEALWRHSILTGHLCQFLARKCQNSIGLAPDELYICGLLHDLGKVVLLDSLREEYLAVVADSANFGTRLYRAEEERLGFTHADVGALVAQQWGLPEAVFRAIQFHHETTEEEEEDAVVLLVRSTNLIAHAISDDDPTASEILDEELRHYLGVSEESVHELITFGEQALAGIVL